MTKSVSQRLEDYWFGIRLQNMNVPAMHLINQIVIMITVPIF